MTELGDFHAYATARYATHLSFSDVVVRITSESSLAHNWVQFIYRSMMADFPIATSAADFTLHIGASKDDSTFFVQTDTGSKTAGLGMDAMLFSLDKELTLALQVARPELIFLHAAALAVGKEGVAIAAPSGSGKSTLTWGLSRSGFSYLSDELCAVNPASLYITPFPRAIVLKRDLPDPYNAPESSLWSPNRAFIPTSELTGGVRRAPTQLKHILFVRYEHEASEPSLRPLDTAETATRLCSNTLNLLAHDNCGLDAAVAIAKSTDAGELVAAELSDTCRVLQRLFHISGQC